MSGQDILKPASCPASGPVSGQASGNESPEIGPLKIRKDFLYVAPLKIRKDFLYVAQGLKCHGRFLLLQARPQQKPRPTPFISAQNGGAAFGLGLTASKKVGNAVARNRCRRRLRVAMGELLPTYGKIGHDYVAVARANLVDAPWPELLADLAICFQKLKPVSPKTDSDPNRGQKKRKPAQKPTK